MCIHNIDTPTRNLKFDWVTQVEAEELLGCKRGKLWKLRREGKIDYAKLGKQTLYYLPSINKCLLQNSTLNQRLLSNFKSVNHEKRS